MDREIIITLIVAITGGTFITGLVAWFRFRADKSSGSIIVSAAQGAVVVQTGVIKSLEEQLERRAEEYNELRARLDTLESERHQLQDQYDDLEARLAATQAELATTRHALALKEDENKQLRARIGHLEADVKRLSEQSEKGDA